MHPSTRLFHACRITLFTRANCSLCTQAKQVLSDIWDEKPFDYKEINVMKSEGKIWRDLYEFDTPVIHVSDARKGEEVPALSSLAKKLMHRFSAEEVRAAMHALEREGQ